MPPKKQYVTRKTIEQFTKPEKLPEEIENEILETLTNYSIDHDMNTDDLIPYYQDLRIPKLFLMGNNRLSPKDLVVEGTSIVDFEKLMVVSYYLILFRNNKQFIQQTWKMILSELKLEDSTLSIDLKNLQEINEDLKTGLSNPLLLDMIASATDGKSLNITITDFAYTLGKLNKLE